MKEVLLYIYRDVTADEFIFDMEDGTEVNRTCVSGPDFKSPLGGGMVYTLHPLHPPSSSSLFSFSPPLSLFLPGVHLGGHRAPPPPWSSSKPFNMHTDIFTPPPPPPPLFTKYLFPPPPPPPLDRSLYEPLIISE